MIYLDNAATSFPKPREVYEAVMNCFTSYASNPGRGSYDMAMKAELKLMEAREVIAELFNIENPLNVMFTKNATEALNIAIKGLLKRGDHVISTVIEHNSVLRPLHGLTKSGVQATLMPINDQGEIDLQALKSNIKKNTKAIIINHASNVLGTIQNINEIGKIAKDTGVIFVLDASQSAGAVPINVAKDKVDIMALPGHKCLLGPQGTGVLYIRKGIQLSDHNQGGTGSKSESMEQPEFLPDKFESGTLNMPGIAGLCEGVKFINKIGISNINKHKKILVEYLVEELGKLPYINIYGGNSYENRCAVISFNIDGIDSSEVGGILNEKGIAVRTGYHCAPLIHEFIGTKGKGTVRVSPGFFNTIEEIEILIKTIREIVKSIN